MSERVIAWRLPAADPDERRRSFALHHSAAAALWLGAEGAVEGADDTVQLSAAEGESECRLASCLGVFPGDNIPALPLSQRCYSRLSAASGSSFAQSPVRCAGSELPAAVTRKFPHLRGCTALRVPEGVEVRRLLRGQLAVSVASAEGSVLNATGTLGGDRPDGGTTAAALYR